MAEKYADTLEDDDELRFASACEPAEPVCRGTPTENSELSSEGGTETPKAPVADFPSIIIETEPELCSPRDEVLQQSKRTLEGGFTLHDAAIDCGEPIPLLLDDDAYVDPGLDRKLYT